MILPLPIQRPTFFVRRLPLLARREAPASIVIAAMLLVIACCVSLRVIRYDGGLNDVCLLLLLIWTCGYTAACFDLMLIDDVLKIGSVLFMLAVATSLASAALAPVSLPLADESFARLDSILFGNCLWPGIAAVSARHPELMRLLSYVYVSLGWQPFLLVLLLCFRHDSDKAWRFTSAWALSLLASVVVFPFCPAVGAYVHFQILPKDVPGVLVESAWKYPVLLQELRHGTVSVLSDATLEGIVAMPSFHAAAAVLLGWGYGRFRLLLLPFGILNLLMWISSIFIGGHYGVDVLAGSVVAFSAIVISGRFAPHPPCPASGQKKAISGTPARTTMIESGSPSRG